MSITSFSHLTGGKGAGEKEKKRGNGVRKRHGTNHSGVVGPLPNKKWSEQSESRGGNIKEKKVAPGAKNKRKSGGGQKNQKNETCNPTLFGGLLGARHECWEGRNMKVSKGGLREKRSGKGIEKRCPSHFEPGEGENLKKKNTAAKKGNHHQRDP